MSAEVQVPIDLAKQLADLAIGARGAHAELKKFVHDDPGISPDMLSAENWLRMATPMLRGAAMDIAKYVDKTNTESAERSKET